jgi:hypothetical protein
MGVRGQVFGVRVRVSPGEAQYLDRFKRSCSSAWVLWGHWGRGIVVGNPMGVGGLGLVLGFGFWVLGLGLRLKGLGFRFRFRV